MTLNWIFTKFRVTYLVGERQPAPSSCQAIPRFYISPYTSAPQLRTAMM